MSQKDYVFALDRLNEYIPKCDKNVAVWAMIAAKENAIA